MPAKVQDKSCDLPAAAVERVIKAYSEDLMRGGCPRDWVKKVLEAAATGYSKQITNYNKGGSHWP